MNWKEDQMHRIIVIAVLSLAAVAAHASCSVSEYAQYKDMVRAGGGRTKVALLYCLDNKLGDIRPGTADSRQCHQEMFKMLDALDSVKASATIAWATEGCNGTPPK